MGYPMFKQFSKIFIKKEDKEKALKAIKNLVGQETCNEDHFAFVHNFKDTKTFEEVMEEWRWKTVKNENGDIIDIDFIGEKIGDDNLLFSKIAPFVKEGSFIDMVGGNGMIWKWIFENKKCKESNPLVNEFRWWLQIKDKQKE